MVGTLRFAHLALHGLSPSVHLSNFEDKIQHGLSPRKIFANCPT